MNNIKTIYETKITISWLGRECSFEVPDKIGKFICLILRKLKRLSFINYEETYKRYNI